MSPPSVPRSGGGGGSGADPRTGAVPLLLVAGEASGDLHGARLLEELAPMVEGLEAFGLGGDHLAEAGLDRVADVSEISVVGLADVLRVLPRARKIFDRVLEEVERRRPELAVLVDFPEFNLRLARALAERGVRVVYYISPQIWAWRKGRVRTIARTTEAVLVLFPFEVDFYRRHGVEAVHVGHPLVDEVPQPEADLEHAWDRGALARGGAKEGAKEGAREGKGEPYRIALLPGSRTSEVGALLPVMLASVRRLAEEVPVAVRVMRAPTIPAARIEEAVALAGLPVEVVQPDRRYRAIADSHFALCASGTATLEVGLLGTPMAVLYRLGSWTWLMGRLLVRLPHVALVNLVLERRAVPELLQRRANPEAVARTVVPLLRDRRAIERIRGALGELRGRLGERGASERAAREVARRLRGERPPVEPVEPAASDRQGRATAGVAP